jgi:hypothetical protein
MEAGFFPERWKRPGPAVAGTEDERLVDREVNHQRREMICLI